MAFNNSLPRLFSVHTADGVEAFAWQGLATRVLRLLRDDRFWTPPGHPGGGLPVFGRGVMK